MQVTRRTSGPEVFSGLVSPAAAPLLVVLVVVIGCILGIPSTRLGLVRFPDQLLHLLCMITLCCIACLRTLGSLLRYPVYHCGCIAGIQAVLVFAELAVELLHIGGFPVPVAGACEAEVSAKLVEVEIASVHCAK